MIHRLYNSLGSDTYAGRGLYDWVEVEQTAVPQGLIRLSSKINDNRCFANEGLVGAAGQNMYSGIDSDNKTALFLRKGYGANEYPRWKYLDITRPTPYVVPLSECLGYDGFTLQMTCTFEDLNLWSAIMGMCSTANGWGLSMGQYDRMDGIYGIGWGFYNVSAGHKRVFLRIIDPYFPSNNRKFNWAFVYKKEFAWDSGFVREGRLYINGVLVGGTGPMAEGWQWSSDYTEAVRGLSLGWNFSGANRHMKGNIYNLLIYQSALSDMEVRHNYNIDKRKYIIP